MPETQRDWLVTCVRGLEDFTAREVREVLDARILEVRPGRVRFLSERHPDCLLQLRSIEHRQIHLGALRLGEDCETSIREALEQVNLEPYLDAMRTLGLLPQHPTFRVTGRKDGDHPFSIEDLQRWAGASIYRRHPWPVDLTSHDLEIYVKLEGPEGWIAGRIPGGPGRSRAWQREHHPAGLNPLIGHAMIRMAAPREGESVLDPFCGSGTLVVEGALTCPGARWHGSDFTPGPLEMTRKNAASAGVQIQLARADARRLPWRAGRFDIVLSNLPFGRRSGSHSRNRKVYFPFFGDLPRLLAPGGRAVVLTLERRLMEQIARECPVEILRQRIVHQRGLNPRIYLLRAAKESVR